MLFCSLIYAQIPVTDATTNANLGLQLSQSAKQLTQLQNTYKLMKQGHEQYKKINGYVQQMGQLKNIIHLQRQAIDNANLCAKKAKGGKFSLRDIETNLSQISGSIKTVQALLQNNMFNMNDGERIQIMEKELDKVKTANAEIRVKLIKMSY
ncbi:hypothetical protein D1631_00075 [Chryseobacterium nematophagum]|uniref:Conjugal transfer protein n=2 Tax=Chryseobacterium nematophagum TaxID=2305228 RepID=A0A3M7TK61_9FLAO|nr:hypothetical protein D1631_00075 [Chryseobacterium nematophagum]